MRKETFRKEMTELLSRVVHNLKAYDDEETKLNARIEICKDLIDVSIKINSLANKQLVEESVNKCKTEAKNKNSQ